MPKPKDKHDEQHLKNVQLYLKRIQELYKLASDEASKIGCSINGVDSSKPFNFEDYPQTKKKMDALLSKFKKSLEVSIVNGIDAEWALSNSKNDEIVNKAFGSKKDKLTDEQKKRYFNNNEDAKDAFIERKRNGLSLSDSVWDFTKRFKSEIEMGLDLGIRSGKSADQMSRSLRDYLQNTNKLFRRYKDEHGILQLSKAANAFHPGQGVYRSSYMNARRLAATETNIAYRTADHLRWKEMDFVVGIEIHLSNNHTCKGRDGKPHDFHDICDELQGKYPKDFKFTGWHPHCRCFATTILKTPDELKSGKPSKSEVKELPSKFKEWYENNKERIDKAKSLPYFIKDNFKDGEFIGQKTTENSPIENNPIENKPKRNKPLTTLEKAKTRQSQRTEEQIEHIHDLWRSRRIEAYNEKRIALLNKLTYRHKRTYPALDKRYERVRKAIFNKLSIKETDALFKKYERGLEIQEKWDKLVWGGFTKEQIANMREIEKDLGILKGRPMSIESADMQSANPNYFENWAYRINCQTCVPAYMLRLRGFNIYARGYAFDSLSAWIAKQHSFDIWENQNGGSLKPSITLEWMNNKGYEEMSPNHYKEYFEEACSEVGVYVLTIGWESGGGHATILQRLKNGKLVYIEPQLYSGKVMRDITELAKDGSKRPHEKRGIARIDDKLFKKKFVSIFGY